MATIAIDIAGMQVNFGIDDADVGRILTAYTAMMVSYDAEGLPITLEPQEVVMRLAQEIVNNLATNARKWEQSTAADEARNAVPLLNISLTVPE
jgi:hypothetical protein